MPDGALFPALRQEFHQNCLDFNLLYPALRYEMIMQKQPLKGG
jgi:hypothetical protein